MYNVNQARDFITALTGSYTSTVTFQVFYDPKIDGKPPAGIAQVWHSTLDESLAFIDYKQSLHAGVYVCINGTDGRGREINNITDLRVLFSDFDGQVEPKWNLQPHITQSRDALHGHAFWLIDAGDLTHDEWSILQKQIALYYDTDEQVVDPCRVVRLPGSLHFKDPSNPQTYSITSNHTGDGHKYTVAEIRQAHILPPEKDAVLNQWAEKRAGILQGVGYEDNSFEQTKFVNFISNAAFPAVLGSGTHEVFRVACYGHDHGISLQNATQLLWEHYNPRCLPPWTDDERDHFEGICHRAYHYSKSAAGCKTVKAGFQSLEPLPEPNCGWEKQSQLFNHEVILNATEVNVKQQNTDVIELGECARSKFRISNNQACMLAPQLTVKSSHYDFALVYDGVNYDGLSLIRSAKQFYEFKGKSWSLVDDDVIKSQVQRSFSVYKPPNAFTSGIFQVVCDHVNVESVENGTWLSNTHLDGANYTVFANGIVDLSSEDLKVMKHTPDFFTLNELPHDFKPDATCPNWHSFLTSIWDDNKELKLQLQEWFGYCLTSDVALQKLALLMGKSRGGKGVITDMLAAMVGFENTCSPLLGNLAKDSTLHEMSDKSLTLIPDAHNVHSSVRDSVLSTLKAIVGGDPISYHEMYKGSRMTRFKTKVCISTNNVPDFNDPSGALVNRLLVFPFWKSFVGMEDTALRSRLTPEIAGITQWAIEGLQRLRANNGKFTEANVGVAEKEELRKDMFPLAEFVESSCVLDPIAFTMLDDLYNAYRLWATMQGLKVPMLKNNFDKTLRNCAFNIHHRTGNKRGFDGITVKSQFATSNANVIGFPHVK